MAETELLIHQLAGTSPNHAKARRRAHGGGDGCGHRGSPDLHLYPARRLAPVRFDGEHSAAAPGTPLSPGVFEDRVLRRPAWLREDPWPRAGATKRLGGETTLSMTDVV